MLNRIKSSDEERYRSLFEGMTEGFALHEIVCDNKGVPCDYRFLEVNPAFERLTGLKQEKVVGRLMSEVLPDDDPTWVRRYGEVALTGRSASFQNYSTQLKRHYEVFAYCPAPRQFAVLFLDVTERKHLETALELAARFPEENPNPVMRLGEGHVVDFANPSAKELLRTQGCPGGGEAPAEIAEPAAAALKAGVPRQIERTYAGRTYLFSLTPISQWGYVNLYATDITERKQAEEALRKREEENRLLADLLENSDQPFAVGHPDGRLGILNGAFERLTGFSRTELSTMDWARALTPPEWREIERAKLEELHRTGQPIRYEKEYLRKDGSRVPIELLVHLRKTDEGQPAFYYSFITDLTERKQTEEALRESESRKRARAAEFEALMEAAPVGIFVSNDTECRWMSGNRAAYDLLRRPRGSNLSKSGPEAEKPVNFRAMKDGKEIPLPELPMQESAATGHAVRDHEMDFVFEDGVTVNILGNVVPLLDESGRPRGAVGTFLDITERKRAEDALRESEERLRVAVEAAQLGTWDLDLVNDVAVRSLRHDQIWGHTEAQPNWSLKTAMQNVVPEDRQSIMEAYERGVKSGVLSHENRIIWPDGTIHWISANGRFQYDDNGRPIRVVGVVADTTERKRSDDTLRESEERFRGLSEALPQIVWTAEATGARDYYNSSALEYAGAGLSDLTGWNWISIIHEQDREATVGAWRQAIATGQNYEIEHRLRRADGEFRWHLTRALPLRNDQGAVIQWIGTATDIHDRKMAEQELERRVAERTAELRESQALMKSIVDSTSDLIWSVDPQDFGLLTFNSGLRDNLLQRGIHLRTGMRLEDVFADKDLAERWRAIYQRALAEGPYTTDYESPTAGSMVVTVNLIKRDGKVFGISVFSKDITQRVRAEKELHRLNRALRALSATDQAMVRAQDESQLLQETCRILVDEGGYRMAWVGIAEQDPAKRVRPVAHAGVEEGYLETLNVTWADTARGQGPTGTAVRTGQPFVCQNILEDPKLAPWREEAKRRGYTSSCALPLRVGGKSIGALTVYSRVQEAFDTEEADLLAQLGADVAFGIESLRTRAERQQAEEAFKAERQRFFAVLETLPPMICLLTPDYHVAFANRAFRERFGESQGRRCYDYCFGRPAPCEFCQTYDVLNTGQPHHWEVSTPEGSVIDVYDFPFRDADGTRMILEMEIDITTRKRAEEEVRRLNEELEQRVRFRTAQLEVSNKELESFSYSVSHDLRAPLRAMDGFSRILLEEYRPQLPEKAQRYLDFVRDGASHMGNLIDGLLALSRLGRQELKTRPVEVAEIVRQSMDDLQADLEGSAVEFVVGTLPSCDADPLLLRQVFVTLLSNALKFSRKQERARIEIGALKTREAVQGREALLRLLDPDSWVYYVRDNGVGFDMRYADKLFGVFQRLHRQEEFKGTGIGLATVQQIVHKHGGQVWGEGEVGKGATFYFTIGATIETVDNWHSESPA